MCLNFTDMSPTFTVNPITQTHVLGDHMTLTCRIDSLPSADIRWMLNGEFFDYDNVTVAAEGENDLLLIIYNTMLQCYNSSNLFCRVPFNKALMQIITLPIHINSINFLTDTGMSKK